MNSYNGFSPEERRRGDRILKKAIKEGKIPDPMTQPCAMCGQTKGIRHYHCEDYSPENILQDATVLCWRCHMMLHTRFWHPKSWHKYMTEVVFHHKQYPPVYRGNDWGQLDINYSD